MTNVEIPITFLAEAPIEPLPRPKFEDIFWLGVPEEKKVVGSQIELNGEKWELTMVGFQGSIDKGFVHLHPENDAQEDAFMVSGKGEMWVWDGLECGHSANVNRELMGVIGIDEVPCASFTLAVASYVHPRHGQIEHLVLNIEHGGKTFAVEPVSTPQGFQHQTVISEPSVYLAVKRRKI